MVSDNIVSLVAHFEGFRARPYRDLGGVWTIGFGDTELPAKGVEYITREEAMQRLSERLSDNVNALLLDVGHGNYVSREVVEATASLAYNIGLRRAIESQWWKTCKQGQPNLVSLLRWRMANGKYVYGLLRRRVAEALHAIGRDWRDYEKYDALARKVIDGKAFPVDLANKIVSIA
ncbi:MAG: hypothetical protein KatS3mg038_2525 [Candidatus Kapaibacterium sp.]|nr:MAG: hypothetical protein KatS3mg038_2525 [Candidatus Kapabacteria bacterium]